MITIPLKVINVKPVIATLSMKIKKLVVFAILNIINKMDFVILIFRTVLF